MKLSRAIFFSILLLVTLATSLFFNSHPLREAHSSATTVGDIANLASTAAVGHKDFDLAVTELPVGDGNVSDGPRVGNVFACSQTFRTGGARHVGEWFHGDTWNPLEKPHVQGEVSWPEATFDMAERATDRKSTRLNSSHPSRSRMPSSA